MQLVCQSLVVAGLAMVLTDSACSAKPDSAGAHSDSSANSLAGSPAHDSTALRGATPSAGDGGTSATMATASADQQFLRMMSDHHKGLIAIVHETIDRKEPLAVRSEAETLDTRQDAELDQMVTMLEQQYHDAYAPKMTPDNKAMLDILKEKTGTSYDRVFRQDIIKHHREGIAMIDQYASKLIDPKLKSMAEKMRKDQQRDIAMLQKKLGTRE